MTKKAKQYSAAEKTKIVMEAIKSEMTIAQISSKYGVHSTQIHAWKKQGIENLDYPLSAVMIRLGTGGVLNPTNIKRVGISFKENLRLNLYEKVAKCLARCSGCSL